jgi:hypothetical protein
VKINSFLKYIFTVASVIYFILAGTGYNIAKYCCNDCEDAGMEFIAHHSCESVHHEANQENHEMCCTHDSEIQFKIIETDLPSCDNENSCDITRVKLDDFSPSQLRLINDQTFKFVSNAEFSISKLSSINYSQFHNRINYTPPDINQRSGRQLLTLKAVLII